MKRNIMCKVIAVFSALVILSVSCVACSPKASALETGKVERLVSVVSSMSRDMLISALPFVSSDVGLDMLDESLAKQQNGQDAGLLGTAIEKMLQYTDAVTLQNVFDSLRILDETFRQECQSIYQNKEGLSLSAVEKRGVQDLLSASSIRQSTLERLLTNHQISDGMVARMLEEAANLSEGGAMLAMDNSGNFTVRNYPSALSAQIEAVWQADGMTLSLSDELRDSIEELNAGLSAAEKSSVGMLFYRVGLLDSAPTYQPPAEDVEKLPGASAGSIEKKDPDQEDSASEHFTVTKDGVISVAGNYENPVVYRVEGNELVPVKMSLYIDGAVVAELSKGEYVVKEVSSPFTDCNGWSKPYIEALYARNIVGGKAEGIFAPEDSITREEFVKLIVELFDLKDEKAVTTFADVPEDAWFYAYVASAQKYGLVNGVSSTEFGVGAKIKRQDMAKIINSVLEKKGVTAAKADPSAFGDFSAISEYAQSHVLSVCGMGIVSGDDKGNFNPVQNATRGEAAKMIYGVLKAVLTRG